MKGGDAVDAFWDSFLYIAFWGVASHFIGQWLPRRWFHPGRGVFACRPWERNGRVYEKLAILQWKTKVPDMSLILRDMLKKEVRADNTSAGLFRLATETCVSETVHVLLIFVTVPLLFRWKSRWGVVFYVVYNVLGNAPYILIQRYNRPRLLALAEKKKQKEENA